jgi:hypothetical protein
MTTPLQRCLKVFDDSIALWEFQLAAHRDGRVPLPRETVTELQRLLDEVRGLISARPPDGAEMCSRGELP